jgi:hypothetical protein
MIEQLTTVQLAEKFGVKTKIVTNHNSRKGNFKGYRATGRQPGRNGFLLWSIK